MQIVEEEDEHAFDFDLLDPTKLIPEELVPVRRVGKLTLNRNPDNFFAETEQVAFHAGHVVPGIDFTNDPLLQGGCSPTSTRSSRASAARTSTRSRSTGRWRRCTTTSATASCARRINAGRVSYHPNSLGGGCPMQRGPAAWAASSRIPETHRRRPRCARGAENFFDHFSQATLFWNSQSAPEQEHIVQALRFELGKVERPRDPRAHGGHAGSGGQRARGRGWRRGWGSRCPRSRTSCSIRACPRTATPEEFPAASGIKQNGRALAALSMANTIKDTIKTRKVAILAADGVDDARSAGHRARP